jgi:hypothetical protein
VKVGKDDVATQGKQILIKFIEVPCLTGDVEFHYFVH